MRHRIASSCRRFTLMAAADLAVAGLAVAVPLALRREPPSLSGPEMVWTFEQPESGAIVCAPAIPALQDLLAAPDCLPALRVLAQYGPDAAPAMGKIVPLLRHESDSEIRWNAARTLATIGPAAKEAAPMLVQAMKDPEPSVREHAAEALGCIGPEAKETIPDLVEVLKDPDARVRRDAVRSLGQMGAAAKSAIESIRPLLQDKEERVRKAARTSLQQIEHSEPRP